MYIKKKKQSRSFCSCVRNSVEEVLSVFCSIINLTNRWHRRPWTFIMSYVCSRWPLRSYCDSSVCDHSQNVSSIIVPRCLSSDSLVLLENRSLKSCSENGIKELVPVWSGIGRGISSSSSSSSLAWLSDSSRRVGS